MNVGDLVRTPKNYASWGPFTRHAEQIGVVVKVDACKNLKHVRVFWSNNNISDMWTTWINAKYLSKVEAEASK